MAPFLDIWAKMENFLRLSHLYFLHKIKSRFIMLNIAAQITINITWKHLSSFQSDLWAWEVALRHRLRREPLEHIKARTDLWPHEKPTGADDAMCYHSMHTLFDEKNNPLCFILDIFLFLNWFKYCDIPNYIPIYFSMYCVLGYLGLFLPQKNI